MRTRSRVRLLPLVWAATVGVVGCGDDDEPSRTTAVPRATVTATAQATTSPKSQKLQPGPLEPGRHEVDFKPRFSVKVPAGWEAGPDPGAPPEPFPPGLVPLNTGLDRGFAQIAFVRVAEVYDGTADLDPAAPSGPADLADVLGQSPLLDAGRARPVTVGGVPGIRLDAESRVTKPRPARLLGTSEFCCLNVESNARYRFIVLDNGVTILVSALAGASWPEALAAVQPVLRSVRFG